MAVAAGDLVLASDMNTALESRVPVSHVALTVATGALGTAETLFMTVPSTLYRANTAFRVRFEVAYTTAAANAGVYFRCRKTNLAGAVVVDFQRAPELAANNALAHRMFYEAMFTTLGSAVTAALAFTVTTASSTVSILGAPPTQVDVIPVGAQADFPDAQDLT